MAQNLITSGIINPVDFPLAQVWVEAATVLKISAQRVLQVQCWQHQLWVNIQGVGGKFISYRRLPMWRKAAIEAIQRCTSLERLHELAAVLRTEIKHYGKYYLPEIIETLRQSWGSQSQKIKREEERLLPLKTHQEAAYAWQQSWINIIRYCRTLKTLQQLVKEIQQQSEEFLDVEGILHPIEEFWSQRRHELIGTNAGNY